MLLGSVQPRLWTRPSVTGRPGPCGCGCALTPATSLGFSVAEFADLVGLPLLPWQRWLVIHAMEMLPDGLPRYRTVMALISRQQGKTTLLKVIAGWWLLVQQVPLILGVSTKLETAAEAWRGCLDLLRSSPELSGLIADVRKTNGQECITTIDGCRYKIAASNDDAGRGFTLHRLIMDEVRQQKTWDTWSAAVKAMTAVPDAQAWCISNAGSEESLVLNSLRQRALQQIADGATEDVIGVFEWSAPDGCALDDPQAWAQANPSLGATVTLAAIRGALITDPEPVFRTEVLCQSVGSLIPSPIRVEDWVALADPTSRPLPQPVVLAIDSSAGLDSTAVAACGMTAAGVPHVELLRVEGGTQWVPAFIASKQRDLGCPVLILGSSATSRALLPELVGAGVSVTSVTAADYAAACVALARQVIDGDLVHLGDPVLEQAVRDAVARDMGDAGSWRWTPRDSRGDVHTLVAVTLARWGMSGRPDPMDGIW